MQILRSLFRSFKGSSKSRAGSLIGGQRKGLASNRLALQSLESRILRTVLYWDPSQAPGLPAGDGAWDLTTANWNTAADGSGQQVAFSAGDDAVFSANGNSTVTVSGTVPVKSVTFNGTGYTIAGGTLAAPTSTFLFGTQNATITSTVSIPADAAGASSGAADQASDSPRVVVTAAQSVTIASSASAAAASGATDSAAAAESNGGTVTLPSGAVITFAPALTPLSADESVDSASLVLSGRGFSAEDSSNGSFSVGSFATTTTMDIGGQSFTPDVAGPNGVGGPGTATSVSLNSFTVGYATNVLADRAYTCFVYSVPLDDQDEVGNADGLLGASSGFTNGSAFGTGSLTRTFNFGSLAIDPTQTYYIYFDTDQYLCCDHPAPYTGGTAINADFDQIPYDIQFQAALTVV